MIAKVKKRRKSIILDSQLLRKTSKKQSQISEKSKLKAKCRGNLSTKKSNPLLKKRSKVLQDSISIQNYMLIEIKSSNFLSNFIRRTKLGAILQKFKRISDEKQLKNMRSFFPTMRDSQNTKKRDEQFIQKNSSLRRNS